MEQFSECKQKANRYVYIADHMLTQTYPMIQDPRMLLAVMENVFLSLTNSISAILHFERYYKNIPPFPDNFESKFNLFKMQLADKYSLKPYLPFILQIKEIITNHKQSPVEFARKNMFVICSDDFRLQTISTDQIKEFIKKTKEFNTSMNNIVKTDAARDPIKNERIFR